MGTGASHLKGLLMNPVASVPAQIQASKLRETLVVGRIIGNIKRLVVFTTLLKFAVPPAPCLSLSRFSKSTVVPPIGR